MPGMFGTSPFDSSSSDPHPFSHLTRDALHCHKRSTVLLALTGQLLADTRELLDRAASDAAAAARARTPVARRSARRRKRRGRRSRAGRNP